MAEETLGTDPGDGISGFGTTLQGSVTGPIGMIVRIQIDGQEADEYDITTMNAPNKYKKFIAGLIDAKGATVELIYHKANMAIVLGAVGGANENWTVTFPDESTLVVLGFIKKLGTTIPDSDKISQSMMLRFSGPPAFTSGSGS